ncbi:MAG: ferritin-like domain-containing protein [Gammaproteobacteria bacterium]|nr:ferritin-like domain-containing protein [Gammaproteobacteria bacterium]MDE1887597.1 ferritin-like domain-containing protein [Gammaproteobacteria bacterium]MDE2024064.1 ferritin-like domain-containing protein [Gammaproteobacteria bacterium]MDE2272883.1 ferritin-like domain-containing protein [Gammaproteobacteria bacterium]
MPTASASYASQQRWTLGDIPWHAIRHEAVARHEELFYLVTSASFIEITTDLYTRNLIEYFAGDPEVTGWLQDHWEHEELQHGQALKHYVQTVWPGFDWERAYRDFFAEYSRCCKVELLEPTRSMEMAARCVVEMGTATYYTTLSRLSRDPVLSGLTDRIREDEVRHYKHFYHYFRIYQAREGAGRGRTLRALWHRLKMIDGEDGLIAMKHVFRASHPYQDFNKRVYRDLRRRCWRDAGRHFPHEMSVKMLIKPLNLSPRFQHIALPVLTGVVRHVVM